MKKVTAAFLLVLIMLSACTQANPSDTEAETEYVTARQTEAYTEAPSTEAPLPDDDISAYDTVIREGFEFEEILREDQTRSTAMQKITAGEFEFNVSAESEFYGSESMIKRDSHHMGDLYAQVRYAAEYPGSERFFFGSFNGDKREDLVTYEDSVLKIYITPDKKIRYNDDALYFSQKTAFSGRLCGTGDFNGDFFTDLFFYTEHGRAVIAYGNEKGFDYRSSGVIEAPFDLTADMIAAGDANGDGKTDIIAFNGMDYAVFSSDDAKLLYSDRLNVEEDYTLWCISDVNGDRICDLVTVIGGKNIRTYFGRADLSFGPKKDEIGNVNIYPTYEGSAAITYMTTGDLNSDGNKDLAVTSDGKKIIYCYSYPTEAPAYDYSTHIIKRDGGYILYNGGLYVDFNKDKYHPTDGDHVLVYLSDDGMIWHRNLDAPAFYLGGELGKSGEWWCGNTIEPEVVYVDGVYYMYYQCENYQTYNGVYMGADRIGYATSTDGLHFERHTESPVIKNDPEGVSYDHEEVIYVENDPDGKCFWMYVRRVINNTDWTYIRIRSADPSSFDHNDAEIVNGFIPLGNQIGYIKTDGGELIFIRITFVQNGNRTIPVLHFSGDGLNWVSSRVKLASVDRDADTANINCYFCGFSTVNGTGELEKDGDGYKFIYGACCSSSPVAPNIFYSNVGFGKCTLNIEVIK